jgi:hypothetical protein
MSRFLSNATLAMSLGVSLNVVQELKKLNHLLGKLNHLLGKLHLRKIKFNKTRANKFQESIINNNIHGISQSTGLNHIRLIFPITYLKFQKLGRKR